MDEIKIKMRADQMQAMHEVIRNANDEGIYMTWIYIVPDGADRDDFEFMAESDETYKEVCDLFVKLVKKPGFRV